MRLWQSRVDGRTEGQKSATVSVEAPVGGHHLGCDRTDLGIGGVIDSANNPYTLTFSATGLSSANSNAVELTGAGTATQLVITTQPSATGTSGSALAQQPVIEVQDAYGNPLSTDNGRAVTATVSVGGTLVGHHLGCDFRGVATFTDLGIGGLIDSANNPYTLTFSATGLSSANSNAVELTSAGTATQLVIMTQPSATAASGSTFAQQPVIEVQDAGGNRVTSNNGSSVTASVSAGGNLEGISSVDTSGGVATFSNLAISGATGITR